VLILNDLYPMAGQLMPTLQLAADAFGLTMDPEEHAPDRLQAALMLEHVRDLLDKVEDDNANYNPARGLEGPAGNFSSVVRRSCRQLADLLFEQVMDAAKLGAPQRVLDAISALATTTLGVERFFTGQRSQYTNPYMLQYAQSLALAMEIEAARLGESAFSFCTGQVRSGRGHYHLQGEQASARRRRQPAKPKPKALEPTIRKKRLGVLHECAGLFKQARQQRVTAKGRERSGSLPARSYETYIDASTAVSPVLAAGTVAHGRASGSSVRSGRAGRRSSRSSHNQQGSVVDEASSAHTGEACEVLYRAGELIYVRPVSGGMWVAQLLEPIIKTSGGANGVRFNADRIKVRYFVPTADLGSYLHAMAFWREGKGGVARMLEDEAAAEHRSCESSGVHFSFEKLDKVTRTTVRGRFSVVLEEARHRGDLVSFTLSEEVLAEARAATSGGEHNQIEEEEEPLQKEGSVEGSVEATVAALVAAAADAAAASHERSEAVRSAQARSAEARATTAEKRDCGRKLQAELAAARRRKRERANGKEGELGA
jgi:hypothetical protein